MELQIHGVPQQEYVYMEDEMTKARGFFRLPYRDNHILVFLSLGKDLVHAH